MQSEVSLEGASSPPLSDYTASGESSTLPPPKKLPVTPENNCGRTVAVFPPQLLPLRSLVPNLSEKGGAQWENQAAPNSEPRGELEPAASLAGFGEGSRSRDRGHWRGHPATARAPKPGVGGTRVCEAQRAPLLLELSPFGTVPRGPSSPRTSEGPSTSRTSVKFLPGTAA